MADNEGLKSHSTIKKSFNLLFLFVLHNFINMQKYFRMLQILHFIRDYLTYCSTCFLYFVMVQS